MIRRTHMFAAAAIACLIAGCSSDRDDDHALLEHRIAMTRQARTSGEIAYWFLRLARHGGDERAGRVVAEYTSHEQVFARYQAVIFLVAHWPDLSETEPAARAAALDPHAPITLRDGLLRATQGRDYSWQAEAVALLQRQAEFSGHLVIVNE